MKRFVALSCIAIMILLLPGINTQAQQSSLQLPPVAQPLVREGDFALSLANALKISGVSEEAQAESMLNVVGVAPKNGWIADYPVTPDILGEIEDSICIAADSGRLAINKKDAVNALNQVSIDFGLYTLASPDYAGESSYTYSANAADKAYSSRYTNQTVINNYYYDYGPPVISYYQPPWDYYYMYTWVAYPFRWNSFWFPGFYTLSDFDRVIIVSGYHRKIISNHIFDHESRNVFVINPEKRRHGEIHSANYVIKPEKKSRGEIHKSRGGIAYGKGFTSQDAKNGALSIVKRSYERRDGAVHPVKKEKNRALSNSVSVSKQRKKDLIKQQPSVSRPEKTKNITRVSPQKPVRRTEKTPGKIAGNKGTHANPVIRKEASTAPLGVKPEAPNRTHERASDFRSERGNSLISRYSR